MSDGAVVQPMPYHVEPGGEACAACGHGRLFDVVGPDGVAAGISFDEEVDAEEYAGALSGAYWKGHAAGLQEGVLEEGVANDLRVAPLLEAASNAQCQCTIKERDSGHLVDCWMPALLVAIEEAAAGVAR